MFLHKKTLSGVHNYIDLGSVKQTTSENLLMSTVTSGVDYSSGKLVNNYNYYSSYS